jgi:Catalase
MTIDVKQMTPRVLAALVSGALASIQPTMIRAEDGTQLVDDFHAAFGKHHARANHAKGVILEGNFAPTDDASALSKAAVFAGPSVPVTIRFSDFGGIPDIPDNIGEANPRGLAIKFRSGSDADLDDPRSLPRSAARCVLVGGWPIFSISAASMLRRGYSVAETIESFSDVVPQMALLGRDGHGTLCESGEIGGTLASGPRQSSAS